MPPPWTAIDLVTAALAAATVVLAAVALGVALFAVWGYRDIRRASVRAAELEARRTAEDVAARQMRAFLDKQGAGTDISSAYEDKSPKDTPP